MNINLTESFNFESSELSTQRMLPTQNSWLLDNTSWLLDNTSRLLDNTSLLLDNDQDLINTTAETFTNISNSAPRMRPSIMTSQQIVYIVALCISIMGLIGNGVTFCALRLHKPQTVYIFYLQILAVADGLVMLWTIAMLAMILSSCKTCRKTIMAFANCHDISQFLSHWLLVMASIDRYLAFNNPFRRGCFKNCCSIKRGWVYVTIIVTVGILLEIPRWIKVPGKHLIIAISLNILPRYLLPLAILLVINFQLVFFVRRVRENHNRLTRGNQKNSNQNRKRSVTIMLMVVVFIFLLCGVTRGIFLIVQHVCRLEFTTRKILTLTTWVLMLFNNAVNFFIYVMFYEKFRENVKNLFRLGFRGQFRHTAFSGRFRSSRTMSSRLGSLTARTAF